MQRWEGRVALVTGASAGIGAGICRELVKHGLAVVGCARRVERIESIAEEDRVKSSPGKIHAVKCDLTKESDILALFNYIRQKFGRIDICINNAGFTKNSPLLTGETCDWKNMLEVNVLALCICTRESIKLMREKEIDDGQIINICSIKGHKMPESPVLCGINFNAGTKFMVRAITEGLRKEVKTTNTNIRVASISPGSVKTEVAEIVYGKEFAEAWFKNFKPIEPEVIAEAVVYILQSPSHVEVNDIIVTPTVQRSNNLREFEKYTKA